jgi:hypothetical protein
VVEQKPSAESFHVPSVLGPGLALDLDLDLEPDFAIGSRVMVPSAEKTILYLTFDVVEAVKGLPLKNSVSISLGAMRPTGAARSIPVLMRRTAALPANDPRIDCLPILGNYAFTHSIGVKPSIFKGLQRVPRPLSQRRPHALVPFYHQFSDIVQRSLTGTTDTATPDLTSS